MTALKDILHYYRPYWPIAIASMAATSTFETIDLVVPYAIGQIINVVAEQPLDPITTTAIAHTARWLQHSLTPGFELAWLLSVVFIVTVVRTPIQICTGDWFHWGISLRARRDNFQQATRHILTLPLHFYDEHNPGRIATRITRGIDNHLWSYPDIVGELVPKLVRVCGIFVIISLIEWHIALLFLLSFLVILSFTLCSLRRLIRWEERLDRYIENTQSRTSELITNIKTVKAFATEANELRRQTQRLQRECYVVTHRLHRGYVILSIQQRTTVQICMFVVLGLTLAAVLTERMSLGHFVTTLTVANMAYAELIPITTMAEMFARRYAAMRRFHQFMELPQGADAALLPDPNSSPNELIERPTYQFTGKLEFVNVNFGYAPQKPVLHNINLRIFPQQTVAFVGRSGSGKSTLLKLLFRYFEPESGQILIDGQNINHLDISAYRQRLAIVHQDVDIFNGTLLDNLTYGNPTATLTEVDTACRIARVDEFLPLIPGGYGAIVGERGVRLSGGQRQRLGIARALLVNPDVLVFDEATSSLDSESERSIQQAMHNILGTRTTLIIAHRLSTIREADLIVVLDRGTICEVGSHAELLAQGGLYHRLHSLQDGSDLRL